MTDKNPTFFIRANYKDHCSRTQSVVGKTMKTVKYIDRGPSKLFLATFLHDDGYHVVFTGEPGRACLDLITE